MMRLLGIVVLMATNAVNIDKGGETNVSEVKVGIEFIQDYQERLPSCYWSRSCGDVYKPGTYEYYAPPRPRVAYPARSQSPPPKYRYQAPSGYRPQYEY